MCLHEVEPGPRCNRPHETCVRGRLPILTLGLRPLVTANSAGERSIGHPPVLTVIRSDGRGWCCSRKQTNAQTRVRSSRYTQGGIYSDVGAKIIQEGAGAD